MIILFSPSISLLLQLTIIVEDVNDNSPVCPELPVLQLEEGVGAGHVITTLVLTDADMGSNARITFDDLMALFNNEDEILDVNATNGEVFTIR